MAIFIHKAAGRLGLLLILMCLWTTLFAQTITVTGTVRSASNQQPFPGVTVRVKGTSNGTTTDPSGKYSLKNVPPDASLVFTAIGFTTIEQPLIGKTVLDASLKEDRTGLNEVVITGYGGAVKKRDLTGSISTVTADQIKQRTPVTLYDALQGQAAGVLIMNDNGDPAGQGSIQIRGASTIGAEGNQPLYVIDGVISENMYFLNPADIESIEVLKDASSAAIYGARGANGVILITTKKGTPGKPRINVSYYHLFGKLSHKLRTTSADELRLYRRLRGDGNNGGRPDSVQFYTNQDNDYQDLLFRVANKDVISLTLSGGQKGLTYYSGVTYTDDKSIVVNSWIKRIQSRFNITYQASSKLSITNNISFAYQTGNTIPVGNTAKVVFDRNPWTSIYNVDGSFNSYIESKRNPVQQAYLNINQDKDFTILYNTRLNYNLLKDLRFTTGFDVTYDNGNNDRFAPAETTSGGDATGSTSIDKRLYWEYQAYLNYNKNIGTNHSFTAMAGFSADHSRSDGYTIAMQKYLNENIFTSNAAQIIDLTKTGTSATANADASFFGRLGYSFKSRYILEGTWRRDGSSRFGSYNKWGDFFSGSAAWRFSDEQFMSWTKGFLDDGKLRYSIGQTGNDRIGDYGSYTTINFGMDDGANGKHPEDAPGYYAGNSGAALSTTMGNSQIQWEATTQADYGLDLTFFNGRMNFTADYYTKTTDQLLYNKQLPLESGAKSVTINLGTIVNSGLEFSLGGTPVKTKDFEWNVNGNVSFQQGKIKSLANHVSFISGNKWLIEEGGKIGDFYVFKNLGVYQYNESNAYDVHWNQLTPEFDNGGSFTGYVLNGKTYTGEVHSLYSSAGNKLKGGETIWQNTYKDSVIDDRDRVIAGNGIPKYYFGFINTFRYKNFTLNFMLNGAFGYQIYNKIKNDQNTFSSSYSPPIWDAVLYSWHQPGDNVPYPDFKQIQKDVNGDVRSGMNSLYLEDGSFIRLSSARLAYTLEDKLAGKLRMKGATVYIFGDNLLTWTNYSWYDPEFSSKGLNIGEDGGKYPKRREIGVGLNVNF